MLFPPVTGKGGSSISDAFTTSQIILTAKQLSHHAFFRTLLCAQMRDALKLCDLEAAESVDIRSLLARAIIHPQYVLLHAGAFDGPAQARWWAGGWAGGVWRSVGTMIATHHTVACNMSSF
jgi:hypothetical protein